MITEEQRRLRKNGIGGSDVAAICNANPYKSAYDVWLEKTSDDLIDSPTNINMQIGNALESLVADAYLNDRNTGQIPHAYPGITLCETPTIYSTDYPYLFGNLDRLIQREGFSDNVLEVKVAVSYGSQKQWKQGIPHYHLYQIAYYRWLTKVEYVDVAVLCMGEKSPRYYRYKEDPCFEQEIIQTLISFWNDYILPKKAPDDNKCAPIIEKSSVIEKNCVIDEEITASIEQYYNAKAMKKYYTDIEADLKTSILSFMGDAQTLVDTSGKKIASHTMQTRSQFDTSTFKKENPDIYTKYCKKSESIDILKLYTGKEIF